VEQAFDFKGQTMTSELSADIHKIIGPTVEAEGLELVEVEVVGKGKSTVLRLYIDKEGGVTVENCATVSRQVGMLLEVEDIIDGQYTLEVSSPGLTRPLKNPDHWKRAVGKLALVVLKSVSPGAGSQKFRAKIESADEHGIILITIDDERKMELSYDQVAKARLEVDF
jgi:ribosome maturation factor RimP